MSIFHAFGGSNSALLTVHPEKSALHLGAFGDKLFKLTIPV